MIPVATVVTPKFSNYNF